jgi:hypothetical protein
MTGTPRLQGVVRDRNCRITISDNRAEQPVARDHPSTHDHPNRAVSPGSTPRRSELRSGACQASRVHRIRRASSSATTPHVQRRWCSGAVYP